MYHILNYASHYAVIPIDRYLFDDVVLIRICFYIFPALTKTRCGGTEKCSRGFKLFVIRLLEY